jgi:hypothetical protein
MYYLAIFFGEITSGYTDVQSSELVNLIHSNMTGAEVD